ncbi:M20 family peptidase [Haloplanus rallus]|jgi:succinyl-diaminopimelate desuccinylase|uniref:M20 family peptidase n=1 Tax=Haloplanus rallus TaxID=1816183 RepID=A0A6B9F680_9EURY|nr:MULTISPECIES: M20 family metallopeptidase [Haloplanus]QGX93851.1 M20 family peptidase [Haloplanus rallus]
MSETGARSSELVELVSDLVSIESENPPGNEKPAAEFVANWFEEEGIEVETVTKPFEDRPQVVARVGSGDPTLVLNGHTDVYPAGDRSGWDHDPYGAEIEDGKLYGRGSVDMKLGLSLAMLTAKNLKPEIESGELDGSIIVHAPIGQETGDPGTLALIEEGYAGDYAVVLEPTQMETVTSNKGLAWYDITVNGEPGHSARPDSGVNAIEEAHPLIGRLLEYDAELRDQDHELVGPGYANLTQIEGGLTGNMIPEKMTLRMERRFFPSETVEEMDEEVGALLEEIAADNDLDIEWERVSSYESTDAPVDSYPAEVFRNHSSDTAGVSTEPAGRPWAADTRWFINHTDVPAITWGPGDSAQCGRYDEHFDIDEAETGLEILQDAAREIITTAED